MRRCMPGRRTGSRMIENFSRAALIDPIDGSFNAALFFV